MNALLFAALLLAPVPAPHRAEGRVLQATAARAYLDAGADDGLSPGSEIAFHRAGIEVARCKLEAVTARASACAARGVRAGDGFALPERPSAAEPKLLPAPPAPELLAAQAKALVAAPIAVVQFDPRARGAEPRRVPITSVELSETAWLATSAGPFQATRADVSIREAEVGLGLLLDVDARAVRWWSRPNPRYRPNDSSQLMVWQASLSRAPAPGEVALSFGRILPWRIPGATVMDGATGGWRGDRYEVGGFAGFVPSPLTLALETDRSTAGAYWSWDQPMGKGIFVRDEGRLAVVRSPELGTRLEGETLATARLGPWLDLDGSARLGFGGDAQAPGNVDAARLEVGARPVQPLRIAAWLAYDGLELPPDSEPTVQAGHSRRAEGSVTWEAGRSLRATLLGGTSRDFRSGLERSWVGPVIDLPRLLFRGGGLSFGYLEELGWSDGRSAWLQGWIRPWARLRVLARLGWSHATALALDQDELAATLALAADLGQAVTARLTMSLRGPLPTGGGGAGDTAAGGTVFATVAARY
jgi:hypothetical protein